MHIAYTIGRQESYDRDLIGATRPHYKVGVQEDYEGGWVWASREAAEEFITQTPNWPWQPKVYGLKLTGTWETDVSPEPHPSDGVHRLLVDSELFLLEERLDGSVST